MRSPLTSFSSSTSARRACACSNGWRIRMSCAVIDAACGPLRRTMPMPPRPGGVEMAAMVSTIAVVNSGTFDSIAMARLNCRKPTHLERSCHLFKAADVAKAEEERQDANDAKAAIDKAPIERNAADGTGDQSQRQYTDTGNDSENEDPLVAHRIDQWAEECEGDHEMPEGEPVRAIGHEGIVAIGIRHALVDAPQPAVEGRFAGGGRGGSHAEDPVQSGCFVLEREGRDAAENQAGDEKRQPDANLSDQPYGIVFAHRCLSRGVYFPWGPPHPPLFSIF